MREEKEEEDDGLDDVMVTPLQSFVEETEREDRIVMVDDGKRGEGR
jgi:hypothetical protein